MKKLLSALVLALALLSSAGPALAEDDIGVAVDVLSSAGAPVVKAAFAAPIGKRSDAAKISVELIGLEPSRDVFFVIDPSPDAFARANADEQGSIKTKIELPYGLTPGKHVLTANTFFSTDDIPASYTVGEIFVSDFGILTNADGTFPKGTKPAPVLLPNSIDKFETAPTFLAPKGTLRVSQPQLRITQAWLPSLAAGLSFNNSTAAPTSFKAKVTLLTIFGTAVGKPYFANIDNLGAGETQTVLLNFANLPPLGFFTMHTELILPNDFAASVPVATSVSDSVFVAPLTVWYIVSALLLTVIALLVFRNVRKLKIGNQK